LARTWASALQVPSDRTEIHTMTPPESAPLHDLEPWADPDMTWSRSSCVDPSCVDLLEQARAALADTEQRLRDAMLANDELVKREVWYRSLVARSSDIAMIFKEDGAIAYASPSAHLLGYDPDKLVGQNANDMCHPDDVEIALHAFADLLATPGASATCEIRMRDAAGNYRWIEEVLTNHLVDPGVLGIVGNLREITDRKSSEEVLHRLALFDELTGLPNRAEFMNRIAGAIARQSAIGGQLTIAFLDVDHFKLVNDSLGHALGDDLLREVGDRLRSVVRGDDVVARFAGDEFVMLCEGGDATLAAELSRRIERAMAPPVMLAGQPVFASVSVGITTTGPYDAEVLLRNADAAMHRAKKLGRARTEVFDEALEDDARSAVALQRDMQQGLVEDQFVLHFQPILDLSSSETIGMEALVRWNHPERGMVPPLAFIPAAEESGLIIPLGAWVLRNACEAAATWPESVHIAVNLSVRQLADRQIVTTVSDALEQSGLDAGRLVLEITESALMDNAEMAIACLHELKQLGVRLAIDDFGTGYSSLVYLKRMPVDIIKIDRSFVNGLGGDEDDTAIVESVVSLAHAVGVSAVAEGVETDAQHSHLRVMGCDHAQGFLWSKPVPAAEVAALFDLQRVAP